MLEPLSEENSCDASAYYKAEMKFELEPYHRGVSDEELIAELQRVASELNKESVTRAENDERGKYNSSTYYSRFGNWFKALQKAGLKEARTPMNLPEELLIEELQQVAAKLHKDSVTCAENDDIGKYNSSTYQDRFGGWNKALERAGLTVINPKKITVEDLFQNLEEVWIKLGRQPRYAEMQKPLSQYHAHTYENHFGTWRKALEKFVDFVNDEERVAFETAALEEPATSKLSDISSVVEPSTGHKTKRNVNWRLRFLVMRRDNFKCRACGRSPATDPSIVLHVDHVKAWRNGGETVIGNLQTLCSKCNIGKSDLV